MAIENLDQTTGGTRTMTGEVDARLTVLERHAISTEKRLDGVDSKLDQIMAVVTKAEAKPAFNPAAAAAAAIIYISSNLNSAPLAVIQNVLRHFSQRLSDAEDRPRWKPEMADSRR